MSEDEADLSALLCDDIKTHMIEVTDKQPINNAGSFAVTLLWQIFEEGPAIVLKDGRK